ncbi:MAG: hypothetical protein M3R72_12060 [Bacteroidota bacterium]|nr:hypothetical protein [Bacteroidota bacterium]
MDQEHIRVVPLHVPKPKLALEDLAKQTGDSELFDAGKLTAPAGPKLTYRGGALLQNVEVFTIFWGNNWANTNSYITLAKNINQFFSDILTSPLIDQLSEYSTAGYTIGHGSLTGTITITDNAPVNSVTDSQLQTALGGWITGGTVPPVNNNTLYFIYTDINVTVQMGGSASCSSFCGYHNNFGQNTYYAVMPFPGCDGCLAGQAVLDAVTGTSSHELCEAITDPVPGQGWYDDTNGEIGDICAWQFKQVAGHNVQLEWSNAANACI